MSLLPVGTEVTVVENDRDRHMYNAIVRGYDISRSKYNLSPEIPGGYHDHAFMWAFLSEVTERLCECGHPKSHHDVLAEDPTGSKHEACTHDGVCQCDGFVAADLEGRQ